MQRTITLGKGVIGFVQRGELRLQGGIVGTAQLLLQYGIDGGLYGLIVLEALLLCLTFHFLRVEAERYGHTTTGYTQPAVLVNQHTAFLDGGKLVRLRLLFGLQRLLLGHGSAHLLHVLDESLHQLLLALTAHGIETIAARTERIALLIGKGHLSGHHLGMLLEIVVDNHRDLMLVAVLILICAHAQRTGLAHVNSVHSGGIGAAVPLPHNNNVTRHRRTAKRLVVQTESADNVGITLVSDPTAKLVALIHSTRRRNEETETAISQLADILGNTEVVNVRKLTAEVLVVLVDDVQACHKRYVGDGKVNAAITDDGVLESLDMYLGVGIEEFQDVTRDTVYLHGLDVTATAHLTRHLTDDVTDTCTTLQHIAALET